MAKKDYAIPKDVMDAGEDRVVFFMWLVEEKGNDPESPLTEMLALQKFPAIMTDDVFIASMPTVSKMFDDDPEGTARLCRLALKKGYKPKPTDCYMPGVAKEEGDPAAFVNHGRGISDLKKTLEQRGYNVSRGDDGMVVSVSSREHDVDEEYANPVHKLNPKIVERIRKKMIRQNPDLAHKDQSELRQQIIDKHGKQD